MTYTVYCQGQDKQEGESNMKRRKGVVQIISSIFGFEVKLIVSDDGSGGIADITPSTTVYMGCGVQNVICAGESVRCSSRIFEEIAQIGRMLEDDVTAVIQQALEAHDGNIRNGAYDRLRAEVDLCIKEANYRLRKIIAPLVRAFNSMQIHAYADPERMAKNIGRMDERFIAAVQKHQFRAAARQHRSNPISAPTQAVTDPTITDDGIPEVSGEPDSVGGLDLTAATLVAAGAAIASAAEPATVSP